MDRHGYCTRQARGRRFLLSKAKTNSNKKIKRTVLYMTIEECIFIFFTNTDNTRNHKNWIKKNI